jgi:hypothetical protein
MIKKKLLCRPRGGLNDTLVQIEKCWLYAEEYNRQLFIDTSKSGLLDNLDNYFQLPPEVSCGFPFDNGIDNIFPNENLLLRLNYESRYSKTQRNYTFINTENLISFDFTKDYIEDILVHEQCGGGRISVAALSRLKIKRNIADAIIKQIEIAIPYDAVHIRNTDYQTNYIEFFKKLQLEGEKNLVLCTDDLACQEYAKNLWGNRLKIPNPAPNTNGKPLHENPNLDRNATNIAAITDLILLVCAENLFYTKLEQGIISGFTQLALDLREIPGAAHKLLESKE